MIKLYANSTEMARYKFKTKLPKTKKASEGKSFHNNQVTTIK